MDSAVEIRPLEPARFGDLEHLFRRREDPAGCWCMWWRLSPEEFSASRVAERHDLLATRAGEAPAPGLLAYAGDEAVGWVAIAPRPEHARIPRSTIIALEDVPDCWSITCFYVRADHRGRGVTAALVRAAVDHARGHGARFVEAYPVDTAADVGPRSSSSLFRGTLATFARAGFVETGRRRGRPTVRLALAPHEESPAPPPAGPLR